MGAMTFLSALSLGQGFSNASAEEMSGKFQRAQSERNAKFAELMGEQALAAGEKQAKEYQVKVNQMVGSQRAALAGSGVDVNSGSALEIQNDTAELGALDVETIKNNAWRQAFGFKQQAASDRFAGEIAEMTAGSRASATILSGGLQALNYGVQGFERMGKSPGRSKVKGHFGI
jgi:hypothetical protein